MTIRFSKSQRRQIKLFLKGFHNKERVDLYKVFTAIVYIVKTGCQWQMLPRHYPKYATVYYHYRHWSDSDALQLFLKRIVTANRVKRGRKARPTIAVIDSQSVRSAYAPSVKGVDGFKKVKGIKRQLAVDLDGRPLCIDITTANVYDSRGAKLLISKLHQLYPTISLIRADKGYRGMTTDNEIKIECVKSNFGTSEFVPLKKRWVVERTISWLESYRRLCRNYEKLLITAKSMACFACIIMVLRM